MGRFFCAMALCVLFVFACGRMKHETAQPVFFSLLFPQLVDFEYWGKAPATPGEAQGMGAVWL